MATTSTKIEITTNDGVAEAWTYRPDAPKPCPAVVFFIDALGVRPAMHQMAERLASKGYFVLLPNVLYRAGAFEPFDPKSVWANQSERERLVAIIKKLDNPSAMRDAAAYLDFLAKQPGVLGDRVGCVGYCMGGRLAFTTAGSHPERVGAVACIHGGNIVTDEADSPHRMAAQIRARLYFGVADNDGSCPPERQGQLAAALGAAHIDYQIELYAGKSHGFAVPDVPVYDQGASEQHWARVFALFDSTLGRANP